MSARKQDDVLPWYERWYLPGLVTVGLVLLLEVGGAVSSREVPLGAKLGIVLAGLAFTLGRQLRETERRTIDSTVERLESGLERIAQGLDDPFLGYLGDRLLADIAPPLHQLSDKGRALTLDNCTEMLLAGLDRLAASGTGHVSAICGQKDWGSIPVQAYYRKNYEIAPQIPIRRIFLEPGDKFVEAEKEILREHLAGRHSGVEGRVVLASQLGKLSAYRMPAGFGFAVFGDAEAVVHWGMKPGPAHQEAGRWLQHPRFIQILESIHHHIWNTIAIGGTPEEVERIRVEILDGRL